MIPWLRPESPFPPIETALAEPNGLLAAGGELTAGRLFDAYRRGIFPWYGDDQPVLWWSPDPRMVLFVDEFRVTRSLRKRVNQRRFAVRVDTAFEEVMRACAAVPRPGQHGTWITPAIVAAYTELHRRGHAHSVEAWHEGRLVGGLYGVAIGRMFFGESMFSHASDASKIALAALVAFCRTHGIALIDCQQNTEHLASLGAREISRDAFESHLSLTLGAEGPPRWTYDRAHWAQLGLT